MKKILGAKNYKKLDGSVSFQLARTNPALTTNVKLVYDGSNMFLESYDANDKLKSDKFKRNRIFCNDLFNRNLKDFWMKLDDDSMFDISSDVDMYKSCVEKPQNYDNDFGYIAPLYIKEKLPEYFVIFKVKEDDVEGELPITKLYEEDIIPRPLPTTSINTSDLVDDVLKLGRNEIWDEFVDNLLNEYGLSVDILKTGDGLYDNELYKDVQNHPYNYCKCWTNEVESDVLDLGIKGKFKRDLVLCTNIEYLKKEIESVRSKLMHPHYYYRLYDDDRDILTKGVLDILILTDKLYNKQLKTDGPLIQMAYHCLKKRYNIYNRLAYYNQQFKHFRKWKFKKWGSKLEMVMEMEELLAFYKNKDVVYNFTLNKDNEVELVEDWRTGILQKSKIVKSFDLSEHTTLGLYIKNYINQLSFNFDNSIVLGGNNITLGNSQCCTNYGISGQTGLLTNKQKNLIISKPKITEFDNDITSLFKEQGLYFPYILNLEFLFDDKDSQGYKYYGLYCNAIDLYQHKYKEIEDLESTSYVPEKVDNESDFTITLSEEPQDKIFDKNKYLKPVIEVQQIANKENLYYSDGESIFYTKDKYRNLHVLPQYKHILQSHMYTESADMYERANVLVNRMLEDDYKFNKLTCHEIINDRNLTYFNYVDPTEVFNTNIDFDKMFGYVNDNAIVKCDRYDDAYRASLGFFIEEKPLNGSSICIKVINRNLQLENGEDYVNREIHLTAKDENIIHIHDKYFGKDVDKPYDDDYDQEMYPNFGNTDKYFPTEDETFVFGDLDNFDGDVVVRNLMKEGFLTVEGECPFVGIAIVYEKDVTTVPITFYKYDVSIDSERNRFVCRSVKKINRTTVFKEEVIEELLGFKPPVNYIRAFDNNTKYSNEIRVYPVNYTYVVEEPDSSESETPIEEDSTLSDIPNARDGFSIKVDTSYPFMGLGICRDSDGNIVKYLKYDIALDSTFEHVLNLTAISEYYDTENVGTEKMVDEIFGEDFRLASWKIKSHVSNGYETDIIIAIPKIVIKHDIPDVDLTDEERAELAKGAYDKADKEHFDYILRDENYKNLFITEPMKPGSYHIAKNKTIFYSTNGTTRDIAHAICRAINSCPEWDREIEAYHKGNLLVFRHAIKGSKYNGEHIEIEVTFDNSYLHNKKINMLCDRYNKKYETKDTCVYRFTGGTDSPKNTFLIDNSDVATVSNGLGEERFIKTSKTGVLARVKSITPFVDNDGKVDIHKSIMTTDENGKHIASGSNRLEFAQRYYPTIGVLSFFPYKDFDTDLLYSIYGDCSKINEEFAHTSDTRMYNIVNDNEYVKNSEKDIDFEKEYDKPSSFINKWVSTDGLDACGNPYRFNFNDIFGSNNICPTLTTDDGDPNNHAYNMPHIVIPKYMYTTNNSFQKIDYPFNTDGYIQCGILNEDYYVVDQRDYIKSWNDKLMKLNEVDFKDLFGGKCSEIKCHEYPIARRSIIETQRQNTSAETIFNGVKFLFERKYDGYKFSFIYIPIFTEKDNLVNKVFMIKNDTNKFICGVMYVSVYNTTLLNYINIFSPNENFFNRTYLYNMVNGDVEIKEKNLSFNFSTDYDYIGIFELNDVKLSDIGLVDTENVVDWNKGIFVTSVLFNDIITYIKENTPDENPVVEASVFNGEGKNIFDKKQYIIDGVESLENIIYENDVFRFENGDKVMRTGVVNGYDHDVRLSLRFKFFKCDKSEVNLFFNGLREICNRTNTINNIKERFKIYSAMNIKSCLDDCEHVEWVGKDNDTWIMIDQPIQISTGMKRYQTYCEPLTKTQIGLKDMFTLDNSFPFSNTVVDI